MINRKLYFKTTENIYDIYDPARNAYGYKVMRPGDTILVMRSEKKRACYSISDVCSYSIENGRDPMAAYERAKEQGHKLVWMNEQPVTLSANKQAQKQVIELQQDEPFEYLGVHYRVTFNRMGDLRLCEVTDP